MRNHLRIDWPDVPKAHFSFLFVRDRRYDDRIFSFGPSDSDAVVRRVLQVRKLHLRFLHRWRFYDFRQFSLGHRNEIRH